MKLTIRVDEKGIITDSKFKTFGCGSAIASASLATEWIKYKHIDEACLITNKDIAQELKPDAAKVGMIGVVIAAAAGLNIGEATLGGAATLDIGEATLGGAASVGSAFGVLGDAVGAVAGGAGDAAVAVVEVAQYIGEAVVNAVVTVKDMIMD